VPSALPATFRPLFPVLIALASLTTISQGGVEHGIDLSSLDRRVVVKTPQDLCRFANAGWIARTHLRPDQSFMTRYNELFYKMLADLDDVAKQAAKAKIPSGDPTRDLVGRFYRVGMDENRANRLGASPLREELAKIDEIRDRPGLIAELARFEAFPNGAGLNAGPIPDDNDNRRMIFELSMGGLNLGDPLSYLADDARSKRLRVARTKTYERVLSLTHLADPVAQAAAAIRIETVLAKASSDPVTLRSISGNYHAMSMTALRALTPGVPWPRFFHALGVSPRRVDVAQPRFLSAFAAAFGDQPLPVWRSYLRVTLLMECCAFLSDNFLNALDIWDREAYGVAKEPKRSDVVAAYADRMIGFAIGKLYVQKYFSPQARQRALDMSRNIKLALREDIQSLDWMSDATKAQALKKVDRMGLKIGYPEKWRDYRALHFKDDSFAQNAIRAWDFEWKRELKSLDKPVDPAEFNSTPQTVNGSYDPHRNDITVTAGWLQPRYFDPLADDASNYGAIGAIIGHEMTHGFDDRGSQFDSSGQRSNWWSKEDRAKFEARAAEVVAQYDGYTSPDGFKVNGKLTLSENIADIGGLAIAYAAYRKTLHGVEPPLKDGFTGDQRFFIAFAQNSAAVYTKEAAKDKILNDWHSPDGVRSYAAMADLPAFYHAFNLPVPGHLPHIW
jgi:putative endopeptidase